MMLIVCKCGVAMRISGEPGEFQSVIGDATTWNLPGYPCPAGCGQHGVLASGVEGDGLSVLSVYDVTVQEAFAAMQGLGLPDERDCGETAVRSLVGETLEAVELSQIRGSNRSVVYGMRFSSGRILYLGSGPEGAIAYRLAPKRSYTNEVLAQEGADAAS